MTKTATHTQPLFGDQDQQRKSKESLAEGAVILRAFATSEAPELIEALQGALGISPFRHMLVRGGRRMSVGMTNCGALGWVSDETGYRYDRIDPVTGRSWPAMPAAFEELAMRAAAAGEFENFAPDACLVNRYEPGAQMGLHQDKNEVDYRAPIVSVSLGLPAVFLFGGARRSDRPRKVPVENGDVIVWGGPNRLAYHGVAKLTHGEHPLTGSSRINLTFRKAG